MNWKAFWITWIVIAAIVLLIAGLVTLINFLDTKRVAGTVFFCLIGIVIFLFIYGLIDAEIKRKF